MRLVLSLYACEPNRGSEPGVGWAWALGMAKRHDTYVLTRANNRDVIEKELERLKLPEAETPKFIYVDLSSCVCKLKKKGLFPISLYYLLWQLKARSTLDSMNLNADIIHHVTFCSFMLLGFWWKRKESVVLGPIGGMCFCPPQYYRLFVGTKRIKEIFRALILRMWRVNFFYFMSKKYAAAMVYVDESTSTFIGKGAKRVFVSLDTAVPAELEDGIYDIQPTKVNQYAFAGILEPRKGVEIALRAFAQAFACAESPPLLKVFGTGSELDKYKRLSAELQIEKSVVFCGKVSQSVLWDEIRKSKALLFPSVRDTCGCITQESLAVQTPLICFNHQGVGSVTDDSCAFRIEPSSWQNSVSGFSEAMKRLDHDPELVLKMGANGRRRVLNHFTWRGKFDFFEALYFGIRRNA